MLDFIFNKRCILCKKEIINRFYPAWICKNCLTQIEFIDKIYCIRCGSPYDDKCICTSLERQIKEIKSCFLYNGVGKELIHKWKYSKTYFVKDYFNRLFLKNYPYRNINFDAVFYIPVHFFKYLSRGFNQSEVLALGISEKFQIKIEHSLKRRKFKKSQFQCKNYIERKENIKDVFKLTKNENYNNILVVDDIITSGSTVNEIAKFFPDSNIYVYTLSIAR